MKLKKRNVMSLFLKKSILPIDTAISMHPIIMVADDTNVRMLFISFFFL